jgi:hypothetical protein
MDTLHGPGESIPNQTIRRDAGFWLMAVGGMLGAHSGSSWLTRSQGLDAPSGHPLAAARHRGAPARRSHDLVGEHGTALTGVSRTLLTVVCGTDIGVVSNLLGVAGGELIIPTLIFLFGIDVKPAGTLSLPTVTVGLWRQRAGVMAVEGDLGSRLTDGSHGGGLHCRCLPWRAPRSGDGCGDREGTLRSRPHGVCASHLYAARDSTAGAKPSALIVASLGRTRRRSRCGLLGAVPNRDIHRGFRVVFSTLSGVAASSTAS